MRRSVPSAVVVPLALLCASCAALQPACGSDARRAVNDLLYFGTAKPVGVVSPQEWSAFLADAVTPRFPAGLSTWSAAGQWRSADGSLTREDSHVLNLVHDDDPAADAAVRAIVADYKTRFQQEAVMRVRSEACVAF